MTIDRRAIRWNGWGWTAHQDQLAENEIFWTWLAAELGMPALLATPSRPLESITIAPSRLTNEQRARFSSVELLIVGGFDRQGDDALADAVQIDHDFRWLIFFVAVFFSSFFFLPFFTFVRVLLVLIAGFGVIFLRLGGFFFIALRFDRRFVTLLQHCGVNAAQHRMLIAGQVEPPGGQAHVRAGGKKQSLAALVEDGIARISQALCHLRSLTSLQRINKNAAQVIFQKLGIREPLAVR